MSLTKVTTTVCSENPEAVNNQPNTISIINSETTSSKNLPSENNQQKLNPEPQENSKPPADNKHTQTVPSDDEQRTLTDSDQTPSDKGDTPSVLKINSMHSNADYSSSENEDVEKHTHKQESRGHAKFQSRSERQDLDEASGEDLSEDDLCESIFEKRRISSSEETWSNLLKHVPSHLQKKVFYLLTEKYPNVVAKSTVDFGRCTIPNSEFKIELKDNTPITCKPYPLNTVYKEAVEETIQDMVQNGLLIQESSAYGCGVFVRSRPDSTNRDIYFSKFFFFYTRCYFSSIFSFYHNLFIKPALQL